jgi:hypothetical protein
MVWYDFQLPMWYAAYYALRMHVYCTFKKKLFLKSSSYKFIICVLNIFLYARMYIVQFISEVV